MHIKYCFFLNKTLNAHLSIILKQFVMFSTNFKLLMFSVNDLINHKFA